MLCQENENNHVDQAVLTLRLFERYHIRSEDPTHTQLQSTMTTENGILKVNGQEVALVYFRSGYTPNDYPTRAHWQVREAIECSRAIKVRMRRSWDISMRSKGMIAVHRIHCVIYSVRT